MTDHRVRLEPGHIGLVGSAVRLFVVRHVMNLEELRQGITAMGPGPYACRGYYMPERDSLDAPRALETGLERICKDIDGALNQAPSREVGIAREFMRRAHHYLPEVPRDENWFEWLALMQHHGAPTRLLDWTYSPSVAVHFALSHASRQPNADVVVWVVNPDWCIRASEKVCTDAGKAVPSLSERTLRRGTEAKASRELLTSGLPASVWPINPFRLNERLTVQRGLFLAPGNVSQSFAENLKALPGYDNQANLSYFVLPRAQRDSLARELAEVNITDATLFPGLDGFAKSLWTAGRFLDLTNLGSFQDLERE